MIRARPAGAPADARLLRGRKVRVEVVPTTDGDREEVDAVGENAVGVRPLCARRGGGEDDGEEEGALHCNTCFELRNWRRRQGGGRGEAPYIYISGEGG